MSSVHENVREAGIRRFLVAVVPMVGRINNRETAAILIKLATTATPFLTSILLVRTVGADTFGTYTYALACVSFAVILSVIGFDAASCRFVASYIAHQQWALLKGFLKRSRQSVTALSILTSAVCLLLLWILRGHFSRVLYDTLRVGCVLIPLLSMLTLRASQLQGLKQLALARLPLLVFRPLMSVSVVLVFVYVGKVTLNAPMVLACNVAVTLVMFFVIEFILTARIPHQLRGVSEIRFETKNWLHTAVLLLGVLISGQLNQRIDILMIGSLSHTTFAGIYVVGIALAGLVPFGLQALNAMAAPFIAEMYSTQSTGQLQHLVSRTVVISSAIAISVVIGLLVGGNLILSVYGEEFQQAYVPLLILAAGQLVNVAAGPVGLLLMMTGNHAVVTRTLISTGMVNIVLNYLLIPSMGMAGAAWATTVATVIWNLVLVYYVEKKLRIRPTLMAVFGRPPG